MIVIPQLVGIDFDLVLLHVAADRRHLGHAVDGLQRVLDEEILLRAQFGQVHSRRRLEHVVEDLSQRRRVGSQTRRDAIGQRAGYGRQLLGDAGAGPVEIDAVVKRHLHEAEAEHALAAHVLRARHGLQGDGQGIGDLVFHVLGRTARPLGEHDHLVLADVGNRIERHFLRGVPAKSNDGDRRDQDDEPFANDRKSSNVRIIGSPPAALRQVVAPWSGCGSFRSPPRSFPAPRVPARAFPGRRSAADPSAADSG